MFNKDDIDKGLYIIDKWHKLRMICPWFYHIKNLVDNCFDDIRVAITNCGKDMDIDIINTNRKTSKPISSTPSCLSLVSQERENYCALNDQNKEDIKWEKIDNKDDHQENANCFKSPPYNTAWPTARSVIPSSTRQIIPNIGSIISCWKLGVLENLTNRLKNISMARFL